MEFENARGSMNLNCMIRVECIDHDQRMDFLKSFFASVDAILHF